MSGAACEEEVLEHISGLGSIIRAEEPRSDRGYGTVRTVTRQCQKTSPEGFYQAV